MAQQTGAQRRLKQGDDGSVASRDYLYISLPVAACCHCAVTISTLFSSTQPTPSHISHALLSSFSKYPAQPITLSSLLPAPSRQTEQPLLPTGSLGTGEQN